MAKAEKNRRIAFFQRLIYVGEYFLLRLTIYLFSLLPFNRARGLGRRLGIGIGKLFVGRIAIARQNIRSALPAMSIEAENAVLEECLGNLGQAAVETFRLPGLDSKDYQEMVAVEGFEFISDSLRAGRGAIIVTGHFGAWEVMSRIFSMRKLPAAAIARRVKNPYVDRYITCLRAGQGLQVIPARDAVRSSIRWLKEGGALIMLIDQRIRTGGLQVPFFGRPALTTSLPAILALRYGVPVHPGRIVRHGDKMFGQVHPAVDLTGVPADDKGILETMARLNGYLENWITEYPGQWLWTHNRWRI